MADEGGLPKLGSGNMDYALDSAVSASDNFLSGGNELTIDNIHSLSSERDPPRIPRRPPHQGVGMRPAPQRPPARPRLLAAGSPKKPGEYQGFDQDLLSGLSSAPGDATPNHGADDAQSSRMATSQTMSVGTGVNSTARNFDREADRCGRAPRRGAAAAAVPNRRNRPPSRQPQPTLCR
jgi:hypothetical protein